jgi:hypothetical protein
MENRAQTRRQIAKQPAQVAVLQDGLGNIQERLMVGSALLS